MEEVEKNERQKQAKLEDERKKSESTKAEELRGIILTDIGRALTTTATDTVVANRA
jgi:hypothetical protein